MLIFYTDFYSICKNKDALDPIWFLRSRPSEPAGEGASGWLAPPGPVIPGCFASQTGRTPPAGVLVILPRSVRVEGARAPGTWKPFGVRPTSSGGLGARRRGLGYPKTSPTHLGFHGICFHFPHFCSQLQVDFPSAWSTSHVGDGKDSHKAT